MYDKHKMTILISFTTKINSITKKSRFERNRHVHMWLQVFRVIRKSKTVLRLLNFKLFVLDAVKNICSLFFADLLSV